MISRVSSPGVLTAMPSAMVLAPLGMLRALDRVDHRREALGLHADDLDARLARARRHRDAGDQAAAADRHHQRVELRAPLEHLERHRALPGDDRFVVVGMDEGEAARARPARSAWARASSSVSPCSTTSAPKPRVRSTFTPGVKRGITISAPGCRGAARGRPRPARGCRPTWRSRPARRCSATVDAACCSAPRSLNEAVNCRFSNLRNTCAPMISDSVRDSTQGVSSTCPRRRSAAARTSSIVRVGGEIFITSFSLHPMHRRGADSRMAATSADRARAQVRFPDRESVSRLVKGAARHSTREQRPPNTHVDGVVHAALQR